MLPLHTTSKSIAFILSSLFFISCSNHSKQDIEIIKALNESIESSNKELAISSMDVFISIQDKTNDVATKERAQIWYPKAKSIQLFSKDVYDYIKRTKQKITDSPVSSTELFAKLKKYRNQILQIDPKISNEFEKSLPVFTRSVNSSKNDQQKLFEDYFNNTSSEAAVGILNKIENNIKINELRLITFCHEQCGVVAFGPCSPDLPIAVQYSTIV